MATGTLEAARHLTMGRTQIRGKNRALGRAFEGTLPAVAYFL